MKKYQLAFTSEECFSLIRDKILQANYSIDIETYYFLEDIKGKEILEILKYKAKQGLKIRVLLDHVGSYDFYNSKTIKELSDSNINIRFFNSLFPFSKNKKSIWFLRNHRRCIMVDERYVFTGSFCIGEPTNSWLELGILIDDIFLSKKTKKVFDTTWSKTISPTFKIGSTIKKDTFSTEPFVYITQSPLQFQRYIYKYYLRSIKRSRETVLLSAPYFILNKKFLRYLKKATKRQVKVTIILPEKTDWIVADLARNTYIKYLLKHNIEVYFYENMIHGKFAIFDKSEGFIGTMNLDNLSIKYNYECGIKITDKDCINDVLHYTNENILKHAKKLDIVYWNSYRNIFTKITEKFIWIFRRFL